MNPTLFRIGLLLAAGGTLASCNGATPRDASEPASAPAARSPADSTGQPPAGRAGEPDPLDRHWVQSDQLTALMRDVSAKTQRNWPEDVPRPLDDQHVGDLERAMRSAAKLAEGLAASAERIPVAVERVDMSPATRAGFQAEANLLHGQARALAAAARGGDADGMRAQLKAISSTCVSCHSRYRDFAGELDTQRVHMDTHGGAALAASRLP